ncbi:MAG TPA: hypothetical protein VKV95_21465 [Terriglobia bacterium]|nr:hypothetical protein [Terriglobia bacterium]
MAQDEGGLLKSYWRHWPRQVRGVLFTEVSIGKRSHGKIPRRIDGVRISLSAPRIEKFRAHHTEFREVVVGKTIESIEVKKSLYRSVIGQAIVGKHLLEIEYGVAAAVPIVICGSGDQLLEQVCARLGVKVWTPRKGFLVP